MSHFAPGFELLQPYPFQKFSKILATITPNESLRQIRLSIGEPQHPTPTLIKDALAGSLDGLARYPATHGTPELREAISQWIARRYGITAPDPARQVLPVNGTREALFALAQTVIDRGQPGATVIMPNPFYQIYEGATLLGGASPAFINLDAESGFALDTDALDKDIWQRAQLVYVCSPGNPTGHVMPMAEWERLFELSDRHNLVIASDECYSEIYFDEAAPPLGGLQAAHALGRKDFKNLVLFSSLSKRSNVPGMRSGFVAGDAEILEKFLLYRTYHGSAMSPPFQVASIAAWNDEAHVVENRRLYRQKFETVVPLLAEVTEVEMPQAGFYLWLKTPIDDVEFAKHLYQQYNVVVLPGSLLARDAHGSNPGRNRVRIALVATPEECLGAAQRMRECISRL
ncbi:MAG: succinyldiaminopimelate transaminase [Burkholderiales bacterium]|jgi:N-succinyldiaminopimelate aminotransferase